ncbi:MAG: hypothetical protein IPL61_07185 [Myxococcales bacterium]|nr:hypothetical protein [Myxococcales bacterium]
MARITAHAFLERFVLPLVAGGEVHVGRPLTDDELDRLRGELDGATVPLVAVDDARTDALATLCARPPALVFGDDELALAVGLHNALVLAHPDADGAFITERMRRRIAGAALGQVSQPITRDRTRVLARHGLLHNLARLGRTDVQVTWWTGKASFFGQRPPARLIAWRGVRRVREDQSRAGFDELLGGPEVAPVAAALSRRSPLTQLVAPAPNGPPLHWEDAVFLLRDAELARAIAYATMTAPGGSVAACARLAAAFEQLVERTPPGEDVRAVAAFLVHLAGLHAVGAADDKASPLVTALGQGQSRPRGLVTYAALPAALAVVASALAQPPGLADEPDWHRRWDLERAAVGDLLGDAVIAGVADRLLRHLDPAAPGPSAAVGG